MPTRARADGTTALIWASYGDDADSAGLLLDAGADVNAANDLGATALWAASQNGSDEMVGLLLDAGADPDRALLLGETPLDGCGTLRLSHRRRKVDNERRRRQQKRVPSTDRADVGGCPKARIRSRGTP